MKIVILFSIIEKFSNLKLRIPVKFCKCALLMKNGIFITRRKCQNIKFLSLEISTGPWREVLG